MNQARLRWPIHAALMVEARAIAEEQVRFWRRDGITPEEAWRALGFDWSWAVSWWEVRAEIIRWYARQRIENEPSKFAAEAEEDMPDWTPDLTQQLENKVGEGLPYAVTAAELGITKNAAIGKAYRMGFKPRSDVLLRPDQVRARRRPQRQSGPTIPAAGECVWPIGDPRAPGFSFCCASSSAGSAYCEAHSKAAHLPTRPHKISVPVDEAA